MKKTVISVIIISLFFNKIKHFFPIFPTPPLPEATRMMFLTSSSDGIGPELPFFFIEVKGPKGKLRYSQMAFQAECERMGVPYLVAWDVREVFDFLAEKGSITTP